MYRLPVQAYVLAIDERASLMIAFYLTINKTAEGGIKLFSSPDVSPTDLDAVGQQALYIFKDDRRQCPIFRSFCRSSQRVMLL